MDWLNLSLIIDAVLGQSDNQILNLLLPIGVKVVGAGVVLIVGWIFAAWFSGIVDKFLAQRTLLDATVEKVLVQILRFAILIVTILLALQMFGVQTATILALLSGVALAIGLAVQGTLSNVAAGVMLLVLRPLKRLYQDANVNVAASAIKATGATEGARGRGRERGESERERETERDRERQRERLWRR